MVKNLIEMNIKRDKSLLVFIKTCKEWEDALKELGKTFDSADFMQTKIPAKVYKFENSNPLPEGLNDTGSRFLYSGEINLAVLRLVGISEGINLKFDILVTTDELQNAVNSLIKKFKKNFQEKFKPFEIKISATFAEL